MLRNDNYLLTTTLQRCKGGYSATLCTHTVITRLSPRKIFVMWTRGRTRSRCLRSVVLGSMRVYRWQHLVPASVCISGEVCVCVNPKLDALTLYTLEEAARNNCDIYVLRWVVAKRRRCLISVLTGATLCWWIQACGSWKQGDSLGPTTN